LEDTARAALGANDEDDGEAGDEIGSLNGSVWDKSRKKKYTKSGKGNGLPETDYSRFLKSETAFSAKEDWDLSVYKGGKSEYDYNEDYDGGKDDDDDGNDGLGTYDSRNNENNSNHEIEVSLRDDQTNDTEVV
jgi:hypothetical protein